MNCSWLPYLTQRWCCERDHMRKGQIKNHGYSDCQTVQVLTPGTPFSTHIHFWMLLPVRKKTILYFSRTWTSRLDCVYFWLFLLFVKSWEKVMKMKMPESDRLIDILLPTDEIATNVCTSPTVYYSLLLVYFNVIFVQLEGCCFFLSVCVGNWIH